MSRDPVAAHFGRRGGLAKGIKGLAAMTAEERRRIALAGVAARRRKKEGEEIAAGPGSAAFRAAWDAALPEQDYLVEGIDVLQDVKVGGTARIERTYRGLKPQPGHKVKEIVVRDRCPDPGKQPVHEVMVAPSAAYVFVSRPTELWREHRFAFKPAWTGGGELSFKVKSEIADAYECNAGPGQLVFRVAHACRMLTIRVRLPIDCGPLTWRSPLASLDGGGKLSIDDACRGWSQKTSEREGALYLVDPLPQYTFALRWRVGSSAPPAPKRAGRSRS